MTDPSFASPERVADVAAGLERLVHKIRECRLEFVAIHQAAIYFLMWFKEYDDLELDPDNDDEDESVCWIYPHLERDIGTSLKLAMGEMKAALRLLDIIVMSTEPDGSNKVLEDGLTRLYEHVRDVIYWDFGPGVDQLLSSDVHEALPMKPFYHDGILRKLPDDVDKQKSNGTPIKECSEESINGSTDESSSEPSTEFTKVEVKVDDKSETLGLNFHAAAKTLKHLSEQEFEDMSETYYVHPNVKKLLELNWKTRSRKGKERSSPRYSRWRTEQLFRTIDGVSEFINPKSLPAPSPRPKPLSTVEFHDMVEKRAIKHEPGIALMRPVSLRDAESFGIRRQTYDKHQPAEILKRRKKSKINHSLKVYRSAIAKQLLSVETLKKSAPSNSVVPNQAPSNAAILRLFLKPSEQSLSVETPKTTVPQIPVVLNKAPSNAAIARLFQRPSEQPQSAQSPTTAGLSKSPVPVKPNGIRYVPRPLRVLLPAESLKPARQAVSEEHTNIPDSPMPPEQTLPVKASTTADPPKSAVFANPDRVTHIPKSLEVPLPVELPATIGPSESAGEPNGTPNVPKPSRVPLRAESLTIAESSITAELRKPTETAVLLDIGWNAPGLTTVDDVLDFAGVLPPGRPFQKTESPKPPGSSKLLERPKIVDSLIVPGLRKPTEFANCPGSVKSTKGFWGTTGFGISFRNFRPVMLYQSAGASSGTKSLTSGSSKSDEVVKPTDFLPPLAVYPTIGPPTKRPSPSSVQQPTDVKRRRKDSDGPDCSESPEFQTLSDEEEDESSKSEASASSSITLVSVEHGSCYSADVSASESNALNQARKRSSSFTQNPTEVKRRGQVGDTPGPPKFMMLDSKGEHKILDSNKTDDKMLDGESGLMAGGKIGRAKEKRSEILSK